MAISLFKLKKWLKMIMGRSSYHVNQDEGHCYSVEDVKGYYNNLTEKITKFAAPGNEIPITKHDNGTEGYFSIAIFQYGLAAYDLWLESGNSQYLSKFHNCVDWTIQNQLEDGSWKTFELQNPSQPFSAMAQGEGISLLVRAHVLTGDKRYLQAAKKGMKFLLKPIEDGGVAEYSYDELRLYEFSYLPLVLNGWIFASWGLLDYYKITKDPKAEKAWNETVDTMTKHLHEFDCGYWSYYNLGRAIASPFYHRLHIAQLNVMHKLTGREEFATYAKRWSYQLNNPLKKLYSFTRKAIQKVMEK